MKTVLSFYDFTTEAVRPWATAGYSCYCYDIQHPPKCNREFLPNGGSITRVYADLHREETWLALEAIWGPIRSRVMMVFGFPVCTDLAVSGAKHFAKKREADPMFQERAAGHCKRIARFAGDVEGPYMVENPVSVLATLWRKPDHIFHPCDYGGYLPEDDVHPRWPDHLPPRDAYTKKTCLWTGGGFVMPEKRPVEPFSVSYLKGDGKITTSSLLFGKLGGKSQKTKNIRSATPRGFARAVFLANGRRS